jgi:methyl-accepting chemotaxis protein
MAKSYAQLENVRELKKAQIDRFFNERKGDIQVLNEMIATLRRETFQKLAAVGQLKKERIEAYFQEREGDVAMLAANATLAQAMDAFEQAFEAEGRSVTGAQWKTLAATYTPWLQQYKDLFGYDDLLLISQDGDVVYSLSQEAVMMLT